MAERAFKPVAAGIALGITFALVGARLHAEVDRPARAETAVDAASWIHVNVAPGPTDAWINLAPTSIVAFAVENGHEKAVVDRNIVVDEPSKVKAIHAWLSRRELK